MKTFKDLQFKKSKTGSLTDIKFQNGYGARVFSSNVSEEDGATGPFQVTVLKDDEIDYNTNTNINITTESIEISFEDQVTQVMKQIQGLAKTYNAITPDEQILAVSKNWRIIEEIKRPSELVQMAAVVINTSAIRFIDNPCEKAQIIAVTKDPDALDLIKEPCDAAEVIAYLIKKTN